MKLREIVLRILVVGATLLPALTVAQQPAKISIGFLRSVPAPTLAAPDPFLQAFRQSLAAHGYVDGLDVIIETRWAGGRIDQLPALAAEMVDLRVEVIVAVGAAVTRAAKSATTTIPVVFMMVIDPAANGFVASLERPGGNLTGFTTVDPQEARKKLELLKEALPGLARVALLGDQALRDTKGHEEQARALGLQSQSLKIAGANPDLEEAFRAMQRERAGALLVLEQPATIIHSRRIAEMAAKYRLPTLFASPDAGGLIEYGTSLVEMPRLMAAYVERILKGAKPADLPVEVVIRQELVVNLSTAREIGVTIPPEVLKRADRIVQ
jgi:putative ABC transport system substrate-binding protein